MSVLLRHRFWKRTATGLAGMALLLVAPTIYAQQQNSSGSNDQSPSSSATSNTDRERTEQPKQPDRDRDQNDFQRDQKRYQQQHSDRPQNQQQGNLSGRDQDNQLHNQQFGIYDNRHQQQWQRGNQDQRFQDQRNGSQQGQNWQNQQYGRFGDNQRNRWQGGEDRWQQPGNDQRGNFSQNQFGANQFNGRSSNQGRFNDRPYDDGRFNDRDNRQWQGWNEQRDASLDPRMQQQFGPQNFPRGDRDERFQQNGQFQQGNQRPQLGITLVPHPTHGVVVAGMSHHMPAESAGIRPGDQIVAVNGQHVFANNDLIQAIQNANPNQPLALEVLRNGQMLNLQAMLSPQPGQGNVNERPALGVVLEQNGPRDVRIAQVMPNSPAQQAGLRPGDRVLGIADQPVNDTDDVEQLVAQSHPNQPLPIHVDRNGEQGTLVSYPRDVDEVFNEEEP